MILVLVRDVPDPNKKDFKCFQGKREEYEKKKYPGYIYVGQFTTENKAREAVKRRFGL